MLKRKLRIETVVSIPLRNYHSDKPRSERYQLRRRGKIAQLLKPKKRRACYDFILMNWRGKMDYKASDFTPDRQRNQTMAVVHFVMKAIDKHIPDDGRHREYATRDLFDALQAAGVDIITCEDRIKAGLPPRGPKGWTDRELQILEAKRMEAMLAPLPSIIFTQEKAAAPR